jgi:hypothetical protein
MDKWKPEPLPNITQDDIERFNDKVDTRPGLGPTGECHRWLGAKSKKGYGAFEMRGRTCRANRIAYFIHYGEDPYPQQVRHTCDWPECVRGEHLIKGSHADNMRDAVERNRMPTGNRNGSRLYPERLKRGNDSPVTKMTDEDALLAINLAAAKIPNSHIAELFDMDDSTIGDIVKRKIRKHLAV